MFPAALRPHISHPVRPLGLPRHAASALALLAALCTAPAAQGALLVDIGTTGSVLPCGLCGSAGRSFGYAFTLSQAVQVDALGAWDQDSDGLGADTRVGLFDMTGTLLTSVTIDATATPQASAVADGRWLMSAVAPLPLAAGSYLIGQVFFDGLPLAQLEPGLLLPAYMTVSGGRHSPDVDAGLQPPLEDFPPGALLGPTLSAQLVPEPGALGLCLLALGACIAIRRRAGGLRHAGWLLAAAAGLGTPAAQAACAATGPAQRFVTMTVPNIATQPPTPMTVKGKLSYPGSFDGVSRCIGAAQQLPAVLILHGSSGVDARGDFYQVALNAAGFVTLQIDMWEARGVSSAASRPAAPILTFPDAFTALHFLAAQPEINPARIGVLGFSWGGVVSLMASEQLYTLQFGGGRSFAAHVAHYPVCYGANNTAIPALQPNARTGTQYIQPTGRPVLVQIGALDDYDNGSAHCRRLAQAVNASQGRSVVQVQEYPGAYHAFDRLMVPVEAADPFGNEGSYFSTGVPPLVRLRPDLASAYAARQKVVQFFRQSM